MLGMSCGCWCEGFRRRGGRRSEGEGEGPRGGGLSSGTMFGTVPVGRAQSAVGFRLIPSFVEGEGTR